MEFEKKTRINAAAFLRNKEGNFLFLQRSEKSNYGKGLWQFLEGGIKWGENPEECLARECTEEIGCLPEKLHLIGTSACQLVVKNIHYHLIRLVYVGKLDDEMIRLSGEHSNFQWLSLEEVLKLDLVVGLREFVINNHEQLKSIYP